MNDFYGEYRKNMIRTMQRSLKQIRQILGIKVQDFGDYMGLSRQSINNLEKGENMSASQYLAVSAMLDFKFKQDPEQYELVLSLLRKNDVSESKKTFSNVEMHSLVNKWFLCFPGNEPHIARLGSNFSAEDIEELVGIYHIFLDDSTFIKDGGIQAVERLERVMLREKRCFVLPLRVEESLRHKAYDEVDASCRKAQEAMVFLKAMQERGSLDLRGEIGDTTVINTLVSVFARLKFSTRMAVLTADKMLADQVHMLNRPGPERSGFEVLALAFDAEGNIRNWPPSLLSDWDRLDDGVSCAADGETDADAEYAELGGEEQSESGNASPEAEERGTEQRENDFFEKMVDAMEKGRPVPGAEETINMDSLKDLGWKDL